MSKTRRSNRSYYDPDDYVWDHAGDSSTRERNEMKERRRLKKMRNALKTKDIDVLAGHDD